jgi:chorismate mutase-like protein
MVQRLDWMDEVAQNKLLNSLPIKNEKREAELLEAMIELGTQSGLPAVAVDEFFKGQILAARTYQEEWLSSHSISSKGRVEILDLTQTVRPALDALGREMIDGLVKDRQSKQQERIIRTARAKLTSAGYSSAVTTHALRGLRAGLTLE